ncbi:hypothetical protein [Bradyrhizobium sp. Ai1a-2]|uniref:hypothetical protein n=1 Tax=Bradyrhizobium sp. Ai1a-2 TaxID=196490 RepID=UPI0003F83C36|nr:hypothetical protein [Bradyrhizobium sp. Ai1a-2]
MARRVIIESNAASPLLVSVPGVDAAGAQFNQVIFNGNQPPLRLVATGVSLVPGIFNSEYAGGKNINEGPPTFIFTPPPGVTPVFIVAVRNINETNPVLQTPYFGIGASGGPGQATGAGGGMVAAGYFCPANFDAGLIVPPGQSDVAGDPYYVNHCVFRNVN